MDPGVEGDGDIRIGPTYTKSTDLNAKGAPAGRSFQFTMSSTNSAFYTGLDATLLAANRHSFTRRVDVYIPAKYKDGTAAPFLIIQDGPGSLANVKLALDNLTHETNPARRLPAFIAIAVAHGGGDSKGSQRGLEYDTMSDRYARFIEGEILPAVLSDAAIKAAYPNLALTKDPDGRATIGCSSGGAAALTMGWFRPDLFRRIITYSGTFVDQQDDDAAEERMYPLGAWEYHSSMNLIANAAQKPLRIFINVNQNDNGANEAESGHHNWVMANNRTAVALKAKNYHYRYVFGAGAGHCPASVREATLPETLLWAWRGYPIAP
ncbi:MAG: enterobactin esterase [Deltaproteobacteria bacterium]|nr:enterobactin esterase [Deltaproteobacteria bacterium]